MFSTNQNAILYHKLNSRYIRRLVLDSWPIWINSAIKLHRLARKTGGFWSSELDTSANISTFLWGRTHPFTEAACLVPVVRTYGMHGLRTLVASRMTCMANHKYNFLDYTSHRYRRSIQLVVNVEVVRRNENPAKYLFKMAEISLGTWNVSLGSTTVDVGLIHTYWTSQPYYLQLFLDSLPNNGIMLQASRYAWHPSCYNTWSAYLVTIKYVPTLPMTDKNFFHWRSEERSAWIWW